MSPWAKQKQPGFTIVELLIVIVVIAILATIGVVAYRGILGRANYTKRLQDMATIRKALQLYKVDNGQFPSANPNPGDASWEVSTDSTFLTSLSQYNTSIPRDPKNSVDQKYAYFRSSAGSYGCPASAGAFYVLRITGLDSLDGRDVSDLGVCKDSTTLSPSRTPTQAQAVFFGFENG
jgi:prepilin-type N-terminal cleavage/methylation domain-containing protein